MLRFSNPISSSRRRYFMTNSATKNRLLRITAMYLHSRYRDLIFFPSKESLFAMIGQVQLEIWRFQCSQSIRLEARRKFVSCGDFLD